MRSITVSSYSRDRKHIPYTVTLREIIHAPDGTIKVSRNVVEAIRNDGSMLKITRWAWDVVLVGSSPK